MNAAIPQAAAEPRLTSLSHGGGCGCKIAPGVLSEILRDTARMPMPPELLVGIETADDAAVYQLNDEQALIATTDFFMPIVDDPFDFGRIAATNAISDVYAMGGKPIMALALVGMPINVLSTATIGRILAGRGIGLPGRGHSDRRRPHDRFGGTDLWAGGAGTGASETGQAQCRRTRRRCADTGQAAGRGRAVGGAQEGAVGRGRIRTHDCYDHAAEHARPRTGGAG